ncbi:putative peptidoglycan lipid II flippase [Nocardioides scoriae]|uniref:Putative peptidoglycan lipid II flippase n=1 Tax=Nocardioides scoriae TaxID=642780 RepID=A0A1H1VUU6_9ACTN|nr:murein biosynthesis integral membrane protein MurJ [Nocardioides scoriae]SDS87996.1 putative peptidoglycan lipid II flippase [Nocardioides scoriae]
MSASDRSRSLLSSSAVMAAGTIFSRLSGFVRGILLAAALGIGLHADVFTIANTVPNMLYVLLAGGVVNAVLVPQLVRSMKNDADGGEAYLNRIVTLAILFLGVVTVLLVVAAPLLMRLFLDPAYYGPDRRAQLDSVVAFARFCLPQVFFYGMFVLVGQVLNSRGRFGPMMWAPIANNVIAVGVLVAYLLVFGAASGAEKQGGFTPGQEALLGLGSTLGIVVQLLVLVPYLRAAGVRYRPRFDFRGAGLGHTLRLGVWTVLFVVVNQVAYTVVVKLASGGTVGESATGGVEGTGYTVYSNSYLLTIVPHSIITVSLATAMLPLLSRYAADGELTSIGRTVASTLRSAYALVVPVAVLFAVMALDLAQVIWGYGAAASDYGNFAPTLTLFGFGLVLFTAHYLVLRGFYALEQTRLVFFVQCAVAATNIVAALLLTRGVDPSQVAPRLVIAYACSYGVGAAVSYTLLVRRVGGLSSRLLLRFLVRLAIAAGLAALVAVGVREAAGAVLDLVLPGRGLVRAVLELGAVGLCFLAAYVGLARVLRITEVNDVMSLVLRRLRPGRGGRTPAGPASG